ncbi:MAG: DUF4156 domain-containing protein [Myxococcota bacterium]
MTLLGFALATACGLSEAAKKVQLYPVGTPVSGCTSLGLVTGTSTRYGPDGDETARDELREKTAELGGNTVVVEEESATFGWSYRARAYRCLGEVDG